MNSQRIFGKTFSSLYITLFHRLGSSSLLSPRRTPNPITIRAAVFSNTKSQTSEYSNIAHLFFDVVIMFHIRLSGEKPLPKPYYYDRMNPEELAVWKIIVSIPHLE